MLGLLLLFGSLAAVSALVVPSVCGRSLLLHNGLLVLGLLLIVIEGADVLPLVLMTVGLRDHDGRALLPGALALLGLAVGLFAALLLFVVVLVFNLASRLVLRKIERK